MCFASSTRGLYIKVVKIGQFEQLSPPSTSQQDVNIETKSPNIYNGKQYTMGITDQDRTRGK